MQTKREAIFQAVRQLLKGRSPQEITISEIARQAGVGKGTVYEYFSSKEELFTQIVMDALEKGLQSLEALSLEGSFEQACRRAFCCFQDSVLSGRLLLGLMIPQNGPGAPFDAFFCRFHAAFFQMERRLTRFLRRLEAVGASEGVVPGNGPARDLLFAFFSIAGLLGRMSILPEGKSNHDGMRFCYRKFTQLLRP